VFAAEFEDIASVAGLRTSDDEVDMGVSLSLIVWRDAGSARGNPSTRSSQANNVVAVSYPCSPSVNRIPEISAACPPGRATQLSAHATYLIYRHGH
jgi:hypothetical protein